jgi:pyridoxal phosphate enzyme (YggS family)
MMQELAAAIRERYLKVLDSVSAAAQRAGRRSDSVRLVVVTKSQPIEVVQAAIEAGARILGENYPLEAIRKMENLQLRSKNEAAEISTPGTADQNGFAVEWHMIGHVQSRKADVVAEHFSLVHSVDSMKLAGRLSHAANTLSRQLPILLEFNVGGEPTKQGWFASEEGIWPELLRDIESIAAFPNLSLRGLMTMPPLTDNPEAARSSFQRLCRLRDFLATKLQAIEWDELSMGTSTDYEVAVEEGATLVRVGQAILGPRPTRETS